MKRNIDILRKYTDDIVVKLFLDNHMRQAHCWTQFPRHIRHGSTDMIQHLVFRCTTCWTNSVFIVLMKHCSSKSDTRCQILKGSVCEKCLRGECVVCINSIKTWNISSKILTSNNCIAFLLEYRNGSTRASSLELCLYTSNFKHERELHRELFIS